MVLQTYYLATAVLAVLATIGWLFISRRVYLSGLAAGMLWSYLALTGASVETLTETGDRVAAPVGDLQFLMLGAALLSFLAVLLYHFGLFPPDESDAITGGNPS